MNEGPHKHYGIYYLFEFSKIIVKPRFLAEQVNGIISLLQRIEGSKVVDKHFLNKIIACDFTGLTKIKLFMAQEKSDRSFRLINERLNNLVRQAVNIKLKIIGEQVNPQKVDSFQNNHIICIRKHSEGANDGLRFQPWAYT